VPKALHTDLYQLTMLASYFHRNMHQTPAVCEMFVRRLPPNRRFLVAAGLDRVLTYLEELRFTDAEIESLRDIPGLRKTLSPPFVEYLRAFRFTGTLHAMPEGTLAFQNEPLVRVEAPLGEAQLIETFLLSAINHQTMIASKAARVVLAAQGRKVLEFGSRRTHPEAAVSVARAAYIAGFAGSSNVQAAYDFDVPCRGTMAHMYIMASESEEEAFVEYAKLFGRSTYLVDTYDTLRGTQRALDKVGEAVGALRLDSGDLSSLSVQVRALLDQNDRADVKIVASSDLDEYALLDLVKQGAVDAAGVGTRLATSDDAPSLGGVYKLVQIGDRPVAKLSQSKVTYPGPHQVYRRMRDDKLDYDHLGLVSEGAYDFIDCQALLVPVMQKGVRTHHENIHQMRERCQNGLNALPASLSEIAPRSDEYASFYNVKPTEQLNALLERCRQDQESM